MSLVDLKEEVADLAENNGIFGKGPLLRVKSATDESKGAQFASELNFLQVEMKTDDGVNEIPIVIKKQVGDLTRAMVDTDTQFANELHMYNVVMPRLGVSSLDIIPKLIFGRATSGEHPEQDILIMEDLRPLGFKVTDDLYLDFDHISKAMQALGQFHGLSYKLKATSPNEFQSLGDLLKIPNPKFDEDDTIIIDHALRRGFDPLLENNPNNRVLRQTLENLTSLTNLTVTNRLKSPEEPFAAIIHGDFNRNNLFYQYNPQGNVTGLKFLDFGTSLLSDPSIDIAFFLYMNSTPQTRQQHWDEFFQIYWEGLTSIEPQPGFTFEEFLEHFAKRAIYGYLPCCHFLPFMLSGEEENLEDFLKKTAEERMEWAYTVGGEEATEAVVGIVRHLYDKGFIEAYLKDLKL